MFEAGVEKAGYSGVRLEFSLGGSARPHGHGVDSSRGLRELLWLAGTAALIGRHHHHLSFPCVPGCL